MGAVVPFPSGRTSEPWVTKAQLQRYYSVSPRTVDRWLERGCPSRKVGGARRFRISDVDEWLDAQAS